MEQATPVRPGSQAARAIRVCNVSIIPLKILKSSVSLSVSVCKYVSVSWEDESGMLTVVISVGGVVAAFSFAYHLLFLREHVSAFSMVERFKR